MSDASDNKGIVATVAGLLLAGALALVFHFEGIRTTAYLDTGGVPTICVGHTTGVKLGQTATADQCNRWLKEDLNTAAVAVLRNVHVPINQNELDAYSSFVFNVGERQFRNSTLLKMLNAGDHKGACTQLMRWVYDNGKKLKGLERRRVAEYRVCMAPSKEIVNGKGK
jgi:lysozyme